LLSAAKVTAMTLLLIGSLSSPYVRKVRIVLAEKKLDYRFQEENPWDIDSLLAQINPLGKVPALVLDGKDVLYDSRVIVEYLDTLSPVGKLIPARGRERAHVKTWEALADGVVDAGVAMRLEQTWAGRTEAQRCQAWVDRSLTKVLRGLDAMQAQAPLGQAFLTGPHLSLADIAVVTALDWLAFRFPERDWLQNRPTLAQLQARLATRPCFVETAPR
jgi:glutathione S-transferase